MAHLIRSLLSIAAIVTLLAGSINVSSPASAEDPVVDDETALTQFREGLLNRGATTDVAAFDALSMQQRADLADYLVGDTDVTLAPPEDATWDENGVATYGNFRWGLPAETAISMASGNDVSIWGTQWFSFLGIKLIEVKNSMTYTLTYDSRTGTRPTAIKNHSCLVTLDTDIFAEVTSERNSAYPDGWEARSQCKVTTKRGLPVPWGIIVTSTTEGLHTIRGDNMGSVVWNSFTVN